MGECGHIHPEVVRDLSLSIKDLEIFYIRRFMFQVVSALTNPGEGGGGGGKPVAAIRR